MSQTQEQPQLHIERFHYSVRLASLFFPMGLAEMGVIAEKAGYQVTRELRERLPDLPQGVRLMISGPLATKPLEGRSLRVDMERGVIAIQGGDIEGVLDDFEEIEKYTSTEASFDLVDEARFYEFILDGEMSFRDGRSPIEETTNLYSDSRLLAMLSPIFETQLVNFGLRLAEKGRNPNANEWFELRIEPSVSKPKTTYVFNMIFRDTSKPKVIEQARSAETRIQQVFVTLRELN